MKGVIAFFLIGLFPNMVAPPVLTFTCSSEAILSGCTSCIESNPNSCNKCAAGHELNFYQGEGRCSLCPPGTGKAADDTSASSCNVRCSKGCNICGGDPNSCINCAAGFYLSAPFKCSSCLSGRGKPTDASVPPVTPRSTACTVRCLGGCQTCGDETECVTCKAGFFKNEHNSCQPCTSGTGKNPDSEHQISPITTHNEACTATCDPKSNCDACSAKQPLICVACAKGRYLRVYDETCEQCPQGCQTCTAISPITAYCTSCQAGYHMAQAGVCQICSGGRGKPADNTMKVSKVDPQGGACTVKCIHGCDACTQDAKQCIRCTAGRYFEPSFSNCKLCHNACLDCTDGMSTDCIRCAADHYYSSSNTCERCPAGARKPAHQIRPEFLESQSDCIPTSARRVPRRRTKTPPPNPNKREKKVPPPDEEPKQSFFQWLLSLIIFVVKLPFRLLARLLGWVAFLLSAMCRLLVLNLDAFLNVLVRSVFGYR